MSEPTLRILSLGIPNRNSRPREWMRLAACTPNKAWTPDNKPRYETLAMLRDICDHCPVIAQCAQYALDEQVCGGVYAGTWLPHTHRGEWIAARHALWLKTLPLTVTKV